MDAVRPFDQTSSDGGGQPIRVVVAADGEAHVMQGNHRVFGAQLDGVTSVGALFYTPEEWETFTGLPFLAGGTGTPAVSF